MRRLMTVAAALVVSLGLALGRGHAQHHAAPAQPMPTPGFYNGLTPNSTMDGDAARLAGYTGLLNADAARLGALATFNATRAYADAVDTATMMQWNEYVWECLKEEGRRSRDARAARRKHLIAMYNERKARIANNPEELDLVNGDALNELLQQLSDPKILPSALRTRGAPIPGETIQRCAFLYPSVGLTISLGRLAVRDGWPLALRDRAFDGVKKAYHAALDTALEQNLQGKLTPDAFRNLQKAVAAFKDKLKKTITASQKDDHARAATVLNDPILEGYRRREEMDDYVQARTFLDDLDNAVAALHDPNAERVLAGVDRYAGTTVGDTVTFMQRFNLRFAPALTHEERESYHLLYATMMRLRDQVVPPGATVPGTAGKVPILINPGEAEPAAGPPPK